MPEDKTIAEQLDAAQDGKEWGLVIQDMFAALSEAKVHIDNATAALKELDDE